MIYESKGFGSLLYPYKGKLEPFDYIAQFKPFVVPDGVDIDTYKKRHAPYCLSGKVKPEKSGTYRRNNDSLLYRDLIFLDYDAIELTAEAFRELVIEALSSYDFILYPTIKHTAEKPRYRLVVRPDGHLTESSYQSVVTEIADKIGQPFDLSSVTWSQLQGLPVTTGSPEAYVRLINRGKPYPVPRSRERPKKEGLTTSYTYTSRPTGQKSMTMRVIDTLLNGLERKGAGITLLPVL